MKIGVALVVALALLALMEPAAAGVKFADADVESEDALWRLYERWLAHFNVSRHPAEKARRFSIFKEAARQIHRRAAVRGHAAPGLNRFVDLSNAEFVSDFGCNDKPDDEPADARVSVTRRGGDGSLPLPLLTDWRDRTCGTGPCLPPVKSQGGCGSCWAFAAVGAVESNYAIQGARDNRGLVDLSEQELVDCDNNGHGCRGGGRNYALEYIGHLVGGRLPLHCNQRHVPGRRQAARRPPRPGVRDLARLQRVRAADGCRLRARGGDHLRRQQQPQLPVLRRW